MLTTALQVKAQQVLPDKILATLKRGHPRLMVSSLTDFDKLKASIPGNPFLEKARAALAKKADSMLMVPLNKYTMIPTGYLLDASRSVLDRSYTLSMMYRLSGQKKYADRLWAELNNAAQFPDWDPTHFLGTAELTHAYAIAYDWLYDVWTADQKKVIKDAIVNKGLLWGQKYYDKQAPAGAFNWTTVDHNWNQVCNGSMTMGALAVADEEPVLAENLLQNALKRIPKAMRHYAPDGAWFEGPTYLAFAMRYNVETIACLETALGTDFGLSNIAGFGKTGEFVVAMSGANGITFNYADAPERVVTMPELMWLAKKFNQPGIAAYQQKWTPFGSAVEMLWYTKFTDAKEPPLDNYFRVAEVASLRSSWNDKNAVFIGFKGGANALNHGHLDVGTFVLEKNGKRWVTDLGPDSYKLPNYFDGDIHKTAQRWTYYRTGTEGHNTLVIKNGEKANQELTANTPIYSFKSGENKSFGLIDLTSAYASANTVKRGISLLNKSQILIQDEIDLKSPEDVYWLVHTRATITLSANKQVAILKLGNQELKAEILSPANGTFEILDAHPLLNEPLSVGNNPNNNIKRLAVHLQSIKQTTITVVFRDVNDNGKIIVQPLANW
ncbi:MAG: heparinase II/III family protein [Bacteroidota bacterium]